MRVIGWLITAILPASEPGGAASSSSKLWNTAISASIPPAGVGTEPPRPRMRSFCGAGLTTSADSGPRAQAVMVKGSAWTFSKPSARSLARPQSRARAAASDPAIRGPTSVVSDETIE